MIFTDDHRRFIRKVFTWPKEMDKILDITMQRITLQRQVMENSLAARRVKLEEMFVCYLTFLKFELEFYFLIFFIEK